MTVPDDNDEITEVCQIESWGWDARVGGLIPMQTRRLGYDGYESCEGIAQGALTSVSTLRTGEGLTPEWLLAWPAQPSKWWRLWLCLKDRKANPRRPPPGSPKLLRRHHLPPPLPLTGASQ